MLPIKDILSVGLRPEDNKLYVHSIGDKQIELTKNKQAVLEFNQIINGNKVRRMIVISVKDKFL